MTSVGMMEATSAGHKRGRLFVYDLFYKTFKGVTKALIAWHQEEPEIEISKFTWILK